MTSIREIEGSTRPGSALDNLQSQPADPLLGLMGAFKADARAHKIDLGLGVYRDEGGSTPVLKAVKAAERFLLETQDSKSYLGPEGDAGFAKCLVSVIFGPSAAAVRAAGIQTPGGCGALRTAGELIAKANPGGRIHIGTPSWPNHFSILRAAGLEIVEYCYFDPTTQQICFDQLMAALEGASIGDAVLLHACCHNPSGADLSHEQWSEVISVLVERNLLPLVDFAYHGLGRGLEPDASAMRRLAEQCPALLLAYSCDKNFGLYRDRAGVLYVLGRDIDQTAVVLSNVLAITRANWSMPPDHGAAVVRTILESDELASLWRSELAAMQMRVSGLRADLAKSAPCFAPLATQNGFFSQLHLSPESIADLRAREAIYMAGNGRINIAGLNTIALSRFSKATAPLLTEGPPHQAKAKGG